MKLNIKLLLIILFSGCFAQAQISFENRIEFDLKDDYNGETVFEFGELGIAMRSYKEIKSNRTTEWKFDLYDVGLRFVKSESIILGTKMTPRSTRNTETHSHTLFKEKDAYTLLSTRMPTLQQEQVTGTFPPKTSTRGMQISGDFAYVYGYAKKAPQLFIINWKTGDKSIVPIRIDNVKMKKAWIENCQVLEETGEVLLFVNVPLERRTIDVFVLRFDQNGEKQDQYNLTKKADKNITEISASRISETKMIFTGTYSGRYTSMSEGIFFAEGQEGELNYIKFYSYLELENFRQFMSRKEKKKLAKKEAKAERKGKELKINYRVASHNVKLVEDGFIFLGEAFYPTYRSQSYMTTTTVNGRPVTRTEWRQVFDGYQYTHAVLAKFNLAGDMVWDQSFGMFPAYKPFYAKRFIRTEDEIDKTIELVFATRNRIISKTFDLDGNLDKEMESEEIQASKDGDKAKWTFSNLNYWYGNYFIAYGRQKIKNKENPNEKKKRKVFFISKIAY